MQSNNQLTVSRVKRDISNFIENEDIRIKKISMLNLPSVQFYKNVTGKMIHDNELKISDLEGRFNLLDKDQKIRLLRKDPSRWDDTKILPEIEQIKTTNSSLEEIIIQLKYQEDILNQFKDQRHLLAESSARMLERAKLKKEMSQQSSEGSLDVEVTEEKGLLGFLQQNKEMLEEEKINLQIDVLDSISPLMQELKSATNTIEKLELDVKILETDKGFYKHQTDILTSEKNETIALLHATAEKTKDLQMDIHRLQTQLAEARSLQCEFQQKVEEQKQALLAEQKKGSEYQLELAEAHSIQKEYKEKIEQQETAKLAAQKQSLEYKSQLDRYAEGRAIVQPNGIKISNEKLLSIINMYSPLSTGLFSKREDVVIETLRKLASKNQEISYQQFEDCLSSRGKTFLQDPFSSGDAKTASDKIIKMIGIELIIVAQKQYRPS